MNSAAKSQLTYDIKARAEQSWFPSYSSPQLHYIQLCVVKYLEICGEVEPR